MLAVKLVSTLTCPICRHQSRETMPTGASQYFYQCVGCNTLLKPETAIAVCSAPTATRHALRFRRRMHFPSVSPTTPEVRNGPNPLRPERPLTVGPFHPAAGEEGRLRFGRAGSRSASSIQTGAWSLAFYVAVGKRADDAALNCCNYDNNSTKMPRHFKSQSNASGCFQDHDFIKVTICIHINAEVIFRKHSS
jgi:hypothetical protein